MIDKGFIQLSKVERQKDNLYDQLKNHKIDDIENYQNDNEEVENDKFEVSNNYNEYEN